MGIKSGWKERAGPSALRGHRETWWNCDEQRSLQEDERRVRKDFSSIPNVLSEDGKGKVAKRATQRR